MFNSKMSVDGSIASSSSQIFAFSVRNVLSITLDVSLSQSKVKNENLVAGFVESDTKVIRFYVSVDEVSIMNILNTSNHLVDKHQHTLQRKLSESVLEERLK